jgi:predicted transglutaminase-like cysteine proteinase
MTFLALRHFALWSIFCVIGAPVASAQGRSMEVARSIEAPAGFLEFCRREPRQCMPKGARSPVALTPRRLQELTMVNRIVNGSVREVEDLKQYGRAEHWATPSKGAGDCEDYALLKRHLLIERGWPSSALLVTTARIETGAGHAVLTVVTSDGDLVLDNRTPLIRNWAQTGYVFFARQNPTDPRRWVAVDVARRTMMASAAGFGR